MKESFTMSSRDLKKLERFFKESPKLIKPVTANVLNTLAFENRKIELENIHRSMIVRSERFVRGSLRVEKTRNVPIEQQIALSGSIKRARFTGWEEQEHGTRPRTRRGFTTAARGGTRRKAAKSRARLKPAYTFHRYDDYRIKNARSQRQQIGVFLKIMMDPKSRSAMKRPGQYILPSYNGMKRGLYDYRNNRFTLYQSFEDENRRPRRTRWASSAMRTLTRTTDARRVWARSMAHVMKRYK
jgi:hypothetical protein